MNPLFNAAQPDTGRFQVIMEFVCSLLSYIQKPLRISLGVFSIIWSIASNKSTLAGLAWGFLGCGFSVRGAPDRGSLDWGSLDHGSGFIWLQS